MQALQWPAYFFYYSTVKLPGVEVHRAASYNLILAYIDICVDMIKCIAFGTKPYIIKN